MPRNVKGETLIVLKPHGSVNWLYCDVCRDIFWVDPEQPERVAQTLFGVKDWKAIGTAGHALEPECPRCTAKSLGTRFATFQLSQGA